MRAACMVLLACASCAVHDPAPPAVIAPWPQAEVLFHQDRDWRGADAAYSIDLGKDRRLWLFGDTFVARPGAYGRSGCAMPRNTIAVQEGRDPSHAKLHFAWRGTRELPTSWFAEDGKTWHWPLHGLRLDDAVTVFCGRVESTGEEGPFGFRPIGWTAFRITGIDGPLDSWSYARVPTPSSPFPVVVGTSVVADGDHVYAYALHEPGDHGIYVLRWTHAEFARGDLMSPEWFDAGTWRAHAAMTAAPKPVVEGGAPEFTVHALAADHFVMVQVLGFPAGELAVREAPRPEGPWSEPRVVFHPPECDRQGVFVYAGKAHLGLWDGGLVATYASNASDFGRLVRDETLYFPRFVRLPWSVFELRRDAP